jgi:hypothetical protein
MTTKAIVPVSAIKGKIRLGAPDFVFLLAIIFFTHSQKGNLVMANSC